MRLLSTSVRGYCWGWMLYTDPNRNPVLGFQWGPGRQALFVVGRNRDWLWKPFSK